MDVIPKMYASNSNCSALPPMLKKINKLGHVYSPCFEELFRGATFEVHT